MSNEEIRAFLERNPAACWCCASVVPCYPHCGTATPAPRYIWTTPKGEDRPLCVECCARWRELAPSDPTMEPLRIREMVQLSPSSRQLLDSVLDLTMEINGDLKA